jgi:putative endonuclease
VVGTLNIKISVTLNLFQGPFHGITRTVKKEKQPCVYMLASRHYGTIYIGVTSNLLQRMYQHRNKHADGFTARYSVHSLVHFEMLGDMSSAIAREKQLKNWHRQWKINFINNVNPHWADLAVGLGLPPIGRSKSPMDAETSSE